MTRSTIKLYMMRGIDGICVQDIVYKILIIILYLKFEKSAINVKFANGTRAPYILTHIFENLIYFYVGKLPVAVRHLFWRKRSYYETEGKGATGKIRGGNGRRPVIAASIFPEYNFSDTLLNPPPPL